MRTPIEAQELLAKKAFEEEEAHMQEALNKWQQAEVTARNNNKDFRRPKPLEPGWTMRTTRVPLYPSVQQRGKLYGLMAGARNAYNIALGKIKASQDVTGQRIKFNQTSFRENAGLRDSDLKAAIQFGTPDQARRARLALLCPSFGRDQALLELLRAYQSSFELKKQKIIRKFNMKFRSYRAPKNGRESVSVSPNTIRAVSDETTAPIAGFRISPTRLGEEPIPCQKIALEKVEGAKMHRLVYLKRTGRFYLDLVHRVQTGRAQEEATTPWRSWNKVVSCDPGVREFVTTYDPDGTTLQFDMNASILKSTQRIDKLKSVRAKNRPDLTVHKRARRNRNLKRKIRREEQKRINRVKFIHEVIINYLVNRYDHIILPIFGVSGMVRKEPEHGYNTRSAARRTIGPSTVRLMYNQAHFRFRQRLVSKVESTPKKRVWFCTEEYTTQCCSCCGLHRRVGGAKEFSCSNRKCGYRCGRDHNAARNIMLKGLFVGPLVSAT